MPITLDGTNGITTPVIAGGSVASQAEAEAGTDNTKLMTPLRVEQSLVATVATEAEVIAGTDNTKLMSPLRAAQSVSRFVPDVENRIVNGAFDCWNRGISGVVNGYVAADRWINAVSGGFASQSQQFFPVSDSLGNNTPTFFLRQFVQNMTLSSHFAATEQRIESARSYAGQTITILGWVRRGSGFGTNMAVSLTQSFGTGGTPSADVLVPGQTVALTDSWAPFAVTFNVPSIAGKNFGTSIGGDYLAVRFWTSAGSDYNVSTNSLGLQNIHAVDFWGIHIKIGTHTAAATDRYRQPEFGPELLRCQRYFWPLYSNLANGNFLRYASGFATATTGANFLITPPTTLRTTPALIASGSFGLWDGGSVQAVSAISLGGDGSSNSLINVSASTATAVLTQFRPYQLLSNTNKTSYIFFDAEL